VRFGIYFGLMARVLLFGAAWILVLAVLAFALASSARPKVAASRNIIPSMVPAPAPPPPRAGTRYPGWTVTRAYSAHHMMVVEVEAAPALEASSIAAQVVEPLKGRYDEVLIYVRDPDQAATDLAARRIQWTRRNGYVETQYRR
jgi:hypothetical protein